PERRLIARTRTAAGGAIPPDEPPRAPRPRGPVRTARSMGLRYLPPWEPTVDEPWRPSTLPCLRGTSSRINSALSRASCRIDSKRRSPGLRWGQACAEPGEPAGGRRGRRGLADRSKRTGFPDDGFLPPSLEAAGGALPPSSPPPARHHPGARSARPDRC